MINQKMEIVLTGKDLATASLIRNLRNVETQGAKSARSLQDVFRTYKSAILASTAAIAGAIYSIKAMTDASSGFELTVKKLSVAVENAGYSWVTTGKKILDFADHMQLMTTYGNEETLKLLQDLMPYTNNVSKAMEGAKIAMDMASAGLFDINTASKYVGMAMQGNVEMLGRYIGELRSNSNEQLKSMTATEKTAYALDLLKKKYGGMSQGEIKTFQGATKQLGNAWGDLLRSFGSYITAAPTVNRHLREMAEFILSISDRMQQSRMTSYYTDIEKLGKKFTNFKNMSHELEEVIDELRGTNVPIALDENKLKMANAEMAKYSDSIRQMAEMLVLAEAQIPEGLFDLMTEEDAQGFQKWLDSRNEAHSEATANMLSTEEAAVAKLRETWGAWNEDKKIQLSNETEFLTFAIDTQKKAYESLWGTIGKMRDTFSSGVSSMFGDMIKGTYDAKKAFTDLGIQMVQLLIDFGVQRVINFALAQALQASSIAQAAATGGAIAAAYAPAAAMVSLASFGGNAPPAMAGISATTALAQTLSIPGLEEGGILKTSGRVLVGERGPEFLDLPQGAQVTPINNAGTQIHIEINNPVVRSHDDIDDLVNAISDRLAFEAERI